MNQLAAKDSVELLDRDMAGKNLSGYWRLGMEGLPNHPMTAVQPCLWKWQDVYDSLVRAGEVISLENSERRVVRLVNPGLDRSTPSRPTRSKFHFNTSNPAKTRGRTATRRRRCDLSFKATARTRRSTANNASWSLAI